MHHPAAAAPARAWKAKAPGGVAALALTAVVACEMQSPGAAQTMTLVPYGSTHLRLTMLPVVP